MPGHDGGVECPLQWLRSNHIDDTFMETRLKHVLKTDQRNGSMLGKTNQPVMLKTYTNKAAAA